MCRTPFTSSSRKTNTQAVAAGKSNLQVHVRMIYNGPAHQKQLCYFERYAYDFRMNIFQASGGDDRCGTDIF